MKIKEVVGTVILDNDETVQFSISANGYSQWGNTQRVLGETVDMIWGFSVQAHEEGYIELSDESEDDE